MVKTVTHIPTAPHWRNPDPAAVLRDVRLNVCSAFFAGGHESALFALAAGSVRLAPLVGAGELRWRSAFKNLLQVAINLRLVDRFGRRRVRADIYAGLHLLDDIEEAA